MNQALIDELRAVDVKLSLVDGRLSFDAPAGSDDD